LYGLSELECICRGCETDAVRRPAARPFVQDAQSAVRLPVSRSRRSPNFQAVARHFGRLERMAYLPVDGQRRSRSRGNHTREVSYAIQCIRRRALTYLVVATPTPVPFAFLSAGYHLEAGWREWQHVASRNGTVSTGVARGSEVAST